MITVNSLGKFQITDGNVVVGAEGFRSPMLSRLLMYMLLYRDKTLTTDDIIAAIWQDEEIDNPAGALKNLMYRLRKVLSGYFGTREYVLTNRGSYQWNPEVIADLDIEHFEKLIAAAKRESICERSILLYEQAIALYQGDFMPRHTDLHWVFTLNTYYHSLYLTCVKGLAEIYARMEKYEELEHLSTDSLRFESGDEELYCYQIEARMHSGKIQLALESYNNAHRIMVEDLGIRKTVLLEKVYEELLTITKGGEADKFEEIKKDIEEDDPTSAFLCGYPVFREIYHLDVRRSIRTGIPEALLLFTIESLPGDTKEVANFRIRQAMSGMEDIIRKGLRAGDVVARYSDTQFVILLPTCTAELARLVADRIISSLYDKNEKYKKVNIKIDTETISREGNLIKWGEGRV